MTIENFERLANTIRPVLLRVAFSFFRNMDEAEDTVQEVLMKLWTKRNSLEEHAEALAVKATKNLCVSKWRKQKLRATQPIDECAMNTTYNKGSDESLMAQEKKHMIELAINSLPKSEQRLIRLRQRGLQSEDISTITGIPIRSIRTMISSARKKIIKQLEI